jgi:hypothetical protein
MAQIYKPPTKEQIFSNASNELKDTLNKMIEIHDILLVNPPNDRKYNKKCMDYFIEYSTILFHIESDNARYTDAYIVNSINNLYDKIFKGRRY